MKRIRDLREFLAGDATDERPRKGCEEAEAIPSKAGPANAKGSRDPFADAMD
jgi:hypothetical protein